MLTVPQALDRLTQTLAAARAAGATDADAIYVGDASTSVQVRLGELEDVSRSEGEDLGLRVFVGQRVATVSSSKLDPGTLGELAARAVAMAREAPEDPYAGLAPRERLMRGSPPDLDLDDRGDAGPEALEARALAAERAARAVEGVTNSEGGSASAGRATVALATSDGFAAGYTSSSYGVSASVLAGEGGAMQRDYDYHSARHLLMLEEPEAVGRSAGERAVRRLRPVKLASASLPVVFDPRVGGSLVGHLLGAISGPAIARGTSFLLEARGTQVFAPDIDIIEDPLRHGGLRSRPFDGEGLPTVGRRIVERGVLTTWLLDSASARQLGEAPTGHASRGTGGPPGTSASNVHLAPGSMPPQDLLGGIARGFYVTELIGQGVNGVTGDYSRGAAGFLIEDGELGPAVAEVTIAGNLKSMFRNLTAADDLVFRYGVNAPTLLVEGMTVAGS